ncbi:MAG: hypothetical protein AAF726_19190 [Planctomycetota bacterium]
MNYSRMSPEQAEALARRDRMRMIGLALGALIIGALYVFSTWKAREDRAAAEAEAAAIARAEEAEEESGDVAVVPFDRPELLQVIADATPAQQELLGTEPLRAVFGYARLQTDAALSARGLRPLDAAVRDELMGAPTEYRLDAIRLRGRVVEASQRPREGTSRDDWMGTIDVGDGTLGHFLVAAAPVQQDGAREIRVGDYLLVDGLFHAIYRTPVTTDAGRESVSAPLVVGQRATASTPEMTEDIARLLPTLEDVVDDELGDVHDPDEFEMARWELMGKAKLLGSEVDWETVPELDDDTLRAIYEDGSAYRGQAYRIPVSINMDTYSIRVDDNPLRLDRVTTGWIGNATWKGPAKTIKWVGPFTRRDMLRGDSLSNENRYVRANGYFFRNHLFQNRDGEPRRAPVFVLESIETFTPEPAWSVSIFRYAVLGLTVFLVGFIFLLLRADRRRSQRLYDDMIRRRRARRDRSPELTA